MKRPTSRRISGRDADGGFMLLELMLALAIIALLASLALPGLRGGASAAALRVKAYETAALLRADRDAAQRTGREVESSVDVGRRRIAGGASAMQVAVPDAVDMRLVSGPNGFRFFPDGRSSGGELSLGGGGRTLRLRVDRLTSAVEIRSGEIRESEAAP